MRFYITIGGLVIGGIIGLMAIFGSWYTVDQGEEAVVLSNGAITRTDGPGLHFKTPFIEDVREVSLQSHTRTYESMEAYSKDQQPANIRLSVSYHVLPGSGAALYAEFGSVEAMVARLIDPRTPAIFKNVFGQYDALTAIQQRAKLNSDALAALQAGVTGIVVIESVQVEDIKFSAAYEQSIEAKQLATVEVQKRQQELAQQQVQAQITVTQAQAAADARVAEAKASAQAVILAGDAEAAAIRAKGEALRDNPSLVLLITAERWDGKLPTTMPPDASVPFLNLSPVPPVTPESKP